MRPQTSASIVMALAGAIMSEKGMVAPIKRFKRPLKVCLNINCEHKTDHKSGFCSADCNKEQNQ